MNTLAKVTVAKLTATLSAAVVTASSGLFVLPATPGAQAPTLTQQEIKSIAGYNSEGGNYKPGSTLYGGWD